MTLTLPDSGGCGGGGGQVLAVDSQVVHLGNIVVVYDNVGRLVQLVTRRGERVTHLPTETTSNLLCNKHNLQLNLRHKRMSPQEFQIQISLLRTNLNFNICWLSGVEIEQLSESLDLLIAPHYSVAR